VFTVDLAEGEVSRTVKYDEAHLIDFDADGVVLGVEVLAPEDSKIEAIATEYGFEGRLPAILGAIRAEVPAAPVATAASSVFVETAPYAGSFGNVSRDERSEADSAPREIDLIPVS